MPVTATARSLVVSIVQDAVSTRFLLSMTRVSSRTSRRRAPRRLRLLRLPSTRRPRRRIPLSRTMRRCRSRLTSRRPLRISSSVSKRWSNSRRRLRKFPNATPRSFPSVSSTSSVRSSSPSSSILCSSLVCLETAKRFRWSRRAHSKKWSISASTSPSKLMKMISSVGSA